MGKGGESFPTAQKQRALEESPQCDLLGDLNAETWLFNRLKAHGVDVYARGIEVTCLRDRIAAAILDNRWGLVVLGKHNGKPENYEQAFQRLYGIQVTDTPPGRALHASRAARATP
jgi:hypothetical protein